MQEYDLIGLLGPILLKSKLLLRELCIHGLSWNDVIPDKLRQDLVSITIERKELNKIRFARSLVPELSTGYPLLVTFSDGSKVAYACISYQCWPTKNEILSTLVSTKTRVAPLKMESIPLVELLGCVAAASLATSIMLCHFHWQARDF